jgi:hypothetical protein
MPTYAEVDLKPFLAILGISTRAIQGGRRILICLQFDKVKLLIKKKVNGAFLEF